MVVIETDQGFYVSLTHTEPSSAVKSTFPNVMFTAITHTDSFKKG